MIQNNNPTQNMSLLSSFNKLTDEFLKKMIITFPDETKITIYYTYFSTMKQYNARKPLEYVMSQLMDKGYHILTRDECFFKRDEIVNTAETFSEKTGLVNMWETTPNEIKNNIWEYIQSIYILGMKAMLMENELKSVIQQIKDNNDNINKN